MSNPYYDPDDFGLVIVGSFDWSEPDYSFDMCVVWYEPTSGKYYWASDSGCSCPSPFEDFHSVDQFQSGSEHDVIRYLLDAKSQQDCDASEYDYDTGKYVSTGRGYAGASIVDLVSRIRLGDHIYKIQEEIL